MANGFVSLSSLIAFTRDWSILLFSSESLSLSFFLYAVSFFSHSLPVLLVINSPGLVAVFYRSSQSINFCSPCLSLSLSLSLSSLDSGTTDSLDRQRANKVRGESEPQTL